MALEVHSDMQLRVLGGLTYSGSIHLSADKGTEFANIRGGIQFLVYVKTG